MSLPPPNPEEKSTGARMAGHDLEGPRSSHPRTVLASVSLCLAAIGIQKLQDRLQEKGETVRSSHVLLMPSPSPGLPSPVPPHRFSDVGRAGTGGQVLGWGPQRRMCLGRRSEETFMMTLSLRPPKCHLD